MSADSSTSAEQDHVQPPSDGVGPLVERDYWALIDRCAMRPSAVMAFVVEHFCELPPKDLVIFEHAGQGKLACGDELDIHIRMAGPARVRVVHLDACSLTLATLEGHPEAGRITFGAYRHESGGVIFHIRSRARASTARNYLGFLFGGDPMQTSAWTDFVNHVALSCGAGVQGEIHGDTRHLEVSSIRSEDEQIDRPTFTARAD